MSKGRIDWLGWALLWAVIAIVAFALGVQLHGAPPADKPVGYQDLVGVWRMRWAMPDSESRFRQSLWADGNAECRGTTRTYLGVWTQANAGELSIAETCHTLPDLERDGQEIEFTLRVVSQMRDKEGNLLEVELKGVYVDTTVKVYLSRTLP